MVDGKTAEEAGVVLRGKQEFGAGGCGFDAARIAGRFISRQFDEAFALLPVGTQTERQTVLQQRPRNNSGGLPSFLIACRKFDRALPAVGRVLRLHHHRSGGGVPALYVALRAAQYFNLLHVPYRLGAERKFVVGGRTSVYR